MRAWLPLVSADLVRMTEHAPPMTAPIPVPVAPLPRTTQDKGASGTIELVGLNCYFGAFPPVRVRRVIGMVFQRPTPFPTMSIRDNVVAGLRLTGRHSGTELEEVA